MAERWLSQEPRSNEYRVTGEGCCQLYICRPVFLESKCSQPLKSLDGWEGRWDFENQENVVHVPHKVPPVVGCGVTLVFRYIGEHEGWQDNLLSKSLFVDDSLGVEASKVNYEPIKALILTISLLPKILENRGYKRGYGIRYFQRSGWGWLIDAALPSFFYSTEITCIKHIYACVLNLLAIYTTE